MGAGGFEPPTLRLSSACSNQLSYAPALAKTSAGKPTSLTGSFAVVPKAFGTKENGADEDRTRDLLLAKQALSQLSYGPQGQWAVRLPQCATRKAHSTEARAQRNLHGFQKNSRSLKTELCDTFERPSTLARTGFDLGSLSEVRRLPSRSP